MEPMILVGRLENKKMKWGIINSDGDSVLPIVYEEILIPSIEYDLKNIERIKNEIDNNSYQFGRIFTPKFFQNDIIGHYDGFYQNHKFIVKKDDKFGLFNANGNQVLNCEYDNISVNDNLDFYLLEKNKKFGFLWIKSKYLPTWVFRNEPSIISNSNIIVNKMVVEELKLEPKLDFKVLRETGIANRSIYLFLINNKKINVKETELLKLLDE